MHLRIFYDGNFIGELDLAGGTQSAGRNMENAIVLADHASVSGRHARFYEQHGAVYIEDLRTTNGTWVNGRRIDIPTRLNSRDQVRLGDTELEVLVEGTPAPAERSGCTAPRAAPRISSSRHRHKPPWRKRRFRVYAIIAAGCIFLIGAIWGSTRLLTAQYYRRGTIAEDNDQARRWYAKAAQRGHADALYRLGLIHAEAPELPDRETAMDYMRRAADRNHPEALYWLGVCHQEARGIPRDDEEAARLFARASARGSLDATYALARCYTEGRGVPMNNRKAGRLIWEAARDGHTAARYEFGLQSQQEGRMDFALKYYRLAAQSNYPPALFKMSQCLMDDTDLPADPQAAEIYRHKAADLGYAEAQYTLGNMYAAGEHKPMNQELAASWFERAAQQGHPRAQYEFAMLLLNGNGVEADPAAAAGWFKRAAEGGHSEAQYQYARCLIDKTGVERNLDEATLWLRQALARGYQPALDGLIAILCKRFKGLPDSQADINHFFKAALAGNSEAQFRLGLAMLEGENIEKDPVEAADWLHRAAENEHLEARYQMALLYIKGLGVSRDIEAAMKLLKPAADQGHADAQFAYAMFLQQDQAKAQDRQQAGRYFMLAADSGHAPALTNLVRMLIDDETAILSDEQTLTWLEQAAARDRPGGGMPEAMCELGARHAAGRGVKRDLPAALQWYVMAVEREYQPALAPLMALLLNESQAPSLPAETVAWVTWLAARAEPAAQYELAKCFEQGQGLPTDKHQALEWKKRAAERGHQEAMHELGLHFRDSEVDNGAVDSRRWLEQAAQAGNIESQHALSVLLMETNDQDAMQNGIEWMIKAAHAGHVEAQYNLGISCYKGLVRGVPDADAALHWLEKALEQDHPKASETITQIKALASKTGKADNPPE